MNEFFNQEPRMEEMGSSSSTNFNPSSESLLKIGLKFGQTIYFEDVGVGVEDKPSHGSSSASVAGGGGGGRGGGTPKKGRSGLSSVNLGGQPPRCQVEGCKVDLSDAKAYYSRHKVCGIHSKTPKVIVAGLEQRFCQQCSRFHLLPEFDHGKRSCRRRLAGHNERRRKPPPGTLLSTRYGSLSPIFENNGRAGGFVMDFSAYPRANVRDQWPSTGAPKNLPSAALGKCPPHPWPSNLDNPPPDLLQGPSANRSIYATSNVPPEACFTGVADSSCALSLLSNQSSGSTNQHSSLGEMYYANPNGAQHLIQPGATDGGVMDHFSSTTWGFKANEVGNSSHTGHGQISHSASEAYSGELELGQQGGRQYMLQHSRAYDSSAEYVHWSL